MHIKEGDRVKYKDSQFVFLYDQLRTAGPATYKAIKADIKRRREARGTVLKAYENGFCEAADVQFDGKEFVTQVMACIVERV